jgi:hypothetical protein
MSWSVTAKGRPADVKAELVRQFEHAKQGRLARHERKALQGLESAAMALTDWAIDYKVSMDVDVETYGSTFHPSEPTEGGTSGSFSLVFQMRKK